MRIDSFRIECFRNIRLAHCDSLPDFIVICGGNGCGKSALLQALMTAKEHAAPYGGFRADPRSVSADAEKATISLQIRFTEVERDWYKTRYKRDCPEFDTITIEIEHGGRARATKRSDYTKNLLSWYSREYGDSPGFFDYIDAHRFHAKKDLSTWNTSALNDTRIKQSLGAPGQSKFDFTKEYLASLVFKDLQRIQTLQRDDPAASIEHLDSLRPIREFFDEFFAPMEFVDVHIDSSPFQFIIRTPRGDIDIDDMSAGEKEVLNAYIRFHQLQPKDAVILFDEADAHLHPDLERRYLDVLRQVGTGNQVWLTTHSPEMMIAAGSDALFTVLKHSDDAEVGQFVRVSSNEQLHTALSDLMGSRGLVSFNQRIVFIEGVESSADRLIYERLYPPGEYNISFVPAGDSSTVRSVADKVNTLLAANVGFQNYYSIIDGDIARTVDAPATGRLFRLPVYHVENFLLDETLLFDTLTEILADKRPYASPEELGRDLKELLFEDTHLNAFAKALLDARIASLAKLAYDAIYQNSGFAADGTRPDFATARSDARSVLEAAVREGDWSDKCKARDLLRAFCGKHGVKYEHFRNLLIGRLPAPPQRLHDIMQAILEGPACDQPSA